MSYFVIAPNGQKFGPADIATLNQWITEGRILPETLLEEESTQTQVVARVVPFLVFPTMNQVQAMPGPAIAAPDANPYLTPMPPQAQRQIHPGYYAHGPQEAPGVSNGQIIGAWVGTFVAPAMLFLCYLGFVPVLFGIVTGIQLKRQGENQGLALIAVNIVWLVAYGVITIITAAHM
jgi:hypothetical protein